MGEPNPTRPVLIALGSNVGEREAIFSRACDHLAQHEGVTEFHASKWMDTSPVGGPDQEDFLNGAAFFRTTLTLPELFSLLKDVERRVGREKTQRWGPREIDLDLLLYDEEVAEGDPTVPHPRMAFRNFVLSPAAEVAANMRHPVIGWTIGELLNHLKICPPVFLFALQDEQRLRRLISLVVDSNTLVACHIPTPSFSEFDLPHDVACEALWAAGENANPTSEIARPKLVITDAAPAEANPGPRIDVSKMTDDEAVVEIVAAIEAMRQ